MFFSTFPGPIPSKLHIQIQKDKNKIEHNEMHNRIKK
jgi:hypothetical protein